MYRKNIIVKAYYASIFKERKVAGVSKFSNNFYIYFQYNSCDFLRSFSSLIIIKPQNIPQQTVFYIAFAQTQFAKLDSGPEHQRRLNGILSSLHK